MEDLSDHKIAFSILNLNNTFETQGLPFCLHRAHIKTFFLNPTVHHHLNGDTPQLEGVNVG